MALDLRKGIEIFGREHLLHKGFVQVSPWAYERPLIGLTQGVGFVKGTGSRKGMFTVNIYWRYTNSDRRVPASAMDCVRRIGEFSSGGDEWYPDTHEESYARVGEIFEQDAAHFLDAHETIGSILRDYEEGLYPASLLFGPDIGWMKFNIGFCYLSEGKTDEASEYLREVVDKHSSVPYEWVQQRKSIAASGLARASAKRRRQGGE